MTRFDTAPRRSAGPLRRRILALAFGMCLSICANSAAGEGTVRFPRPSGYVNDFAGVVAPEEEKRITGLIAEVKEKTGAEISVVTVESLEGLSIEEYAVRLFRVWGIGGKDGDDGLLLLNATGERKIRIEVGYGLEAIIPDGLVGEVRDMYLIPYLKENRYGEAYYYSVLALGGVIARSRGATLGNGTLSDRPGPVRGRGRSSGLPGIVVFLIIFLIFGRSRLFPWILIGSMMGGGGRGSSGWGGIGKGSGGFGGGFGGFGGGMSGGGGASGSY